MKKSLRSTLYVAALYVLGYTGSALAAASGSIVFDPTNYVQTTSSAINTARQVAESIQQTRAQLFMGKKMLDDIKGLNVGEITGRAGGHDANLYGNLTAAQQDYLNMISQLETLNKRYGTKADAARQSGMSLDAFVAQQQSEARAGNRDAQKILKRDEEVLRSTQDSLKASQEWRAKIGGLNQNLGGSMQLLNTQLATVVSGNAEMLAYMAKTNSDAAIRRADFANAAAESAEKKAAEIGSMRSREQADLQRMQNIQGNIVNPWKGK